jgi:hypothetical protein
LDEKRRSSKCAFGGLAGARWIALAVAGAAAGCCSLEDAWRAARERDAAALRESIARDQPGDHLGIHIDLERLNRLFGTLLLPEELPRAEQRLTLGPAGSDAPAVILRAELTSVSFRAGTRDGCLEIAAGYRLSLDSNLGAPLKAALGMPAQGFSREGRVSFQASLAPRAEPDGTSLGVDLGLSLAEAFQSAAGLLPEGLRERLRQGLDGASAALSGTRAGMAGILHLRGRRKDRAGLAVAVRSIHTDRQNNQLYLGLTTNLDLGKSALLEYQGPASLNGADLRVRASAGLFESFLRAALSGRLPRAGREGFGAGEFARAKITLNRLSFSGGKIVLGITIWRTKFPCVEAEVAVSASVERDEQGRFALALDDPVVERAMVGEKLVQETLEKRAPKIRALKDRLSGLLNEQYFDLGVARKIRWQPAVYRFSERILELDARLEPAEKQKETLGTGPGL